MHVPVRTLFATVLLLLLCTQSAWAQMWRYSAGYSVQHTEFRAVAHPGFEGRIEPVNKGMLHLQVERYLLYRLYAAVSANILVHNQETVFLGGPVDFNQTDLGLHLGMQWSRFGLYAGGQTGRVWNLRWRGTDPWEEPMSLRPLPPEKEAYWTTGWKVGATYLLMPWVRLFGEVVHHGRWQGLAHAPERAGYLPDARVGEFGGWSYRAGLTLSIPWHSQRRAQRVRSGGSLPGVMGMGGVRLRSPLEEGTTVASRFGRRWGRLHQGVDLRASRGTPVLSSSDGVVIEARTASGYGRMILIQHANGFQTRYAHLDRIQVRSGQSVRQGERIGAVGDSGSTTGVHLHFEVMREGRPVDPESMIRFE